MANPPRCGKCGAELTSDAPEGLCSACVLTFGLRGFASDNAPAPPDSPTHLGDAPAPLRSPGSALRDFGDYELLDEIARGGMGVVYRARQKSLNRMVALKMILAGQFASHEHVLRFRAEAEAAANLRHPNIVAIYDTGEHDGQPYFSMEYVEGRNLAELVREKPLSPKRAAGCVRTIADAIHYAHEQGILHRDLKPSNILIDQSDQPRVTDFGLAKRMQRDSFLTVTGEVLGSPSFMPPEQVGAKRGKVGRYSDVYGLGAILYYLVTRRPPFMADTAASTLQEVLQADPVSPRLLNASVPQDLATICLRCLEKEPSKRYPTARALAEELDRFLRVEPILSRPVSQAEKVWRWCRRKPALASSLAAALALLLVIATGAAMAAFRISRQRETLRRHLYVADIGNAYHAVQENNLGRAIELLGKHIPRPGQDDLRGFEWRYLWQCCKGDEIYSFPSHSNSLNCAVFSPQGTLFATAGHDKRVEVFDAASKQLRQGLMGFDDFIDLRAMAFSPDGSLLVAKGGTNVIVWETTHWRELKRLEGVPNWNVNNAVVFSPEGKTLATRSAGGVGIWETSTWQRTKLIAGPQRFGTVLAYSTDGKTFAASDWGVLHVFDSESWSPIRTITNTVGLQHRILSLVFSTNLVVIGDRDGVVTLREFATWRGIAVTNLTEVL